MAGSHPLILREFRSISTILLQVPIVLARVTVLQITIDNWYAIMIGNGERSRRTLIHLIQGEPARHLDNTVPCKHIRHRYDDFKRRDTPTGSDPEEDTTAGFAIP